MEGLAAFFLESTFLGLWVFGWDRLPRSVHLACIWLVAAGTVLSAGFIMAANSWMQHPVGYTINSKTGRAELNNIGALFANPVVLWGYAHVLLASAVTGALVTLAVSAWQVRKGSSGDAFGHIAKISRVVLLPATILAMFVGSKLGVSRPVPAHEDRGGRSPVGHMPAVLVLSVRVGGGRNDETPIQILEIPHLLSLLATNSWNGQVEGLNQVNTQYQKEHGPSDYVPNIFIQYWSMRVMAYTAALVFLLALWGAWAVWRHRLERARWFLFLRRGSPSHLSYEHGGLVAHRERSAALDRPGPHADQGWCIDVELDLGRDHLGPVRPGIRHFRCH